MRLLGKSSGEIGLLFNVTDRMARTYVARGRDAAIEELIRLKGTDGVIKQYAVLNHILDEYLAAWQRSKEKHIKKSANVKKLGVAGGSIDPSGLNVVEQKSGQTEEERIGNPEYLAGALRAASEIRALLGLDAPTVSRLIISADPNAALEGSDNYDSLANLSSQKLQELYRKKVTLG